MMRIQEMHERYTNIIKANVNILKHEENITELPACPIKIFTEMLKTSTPSPNFSLFQTFT